MGLFITTEGIEGAGKSLQTKRLAASLKAQGHRVLMTREPGGTPLGEELRRILLSADGPQRQPVAELLLYLADRCQHLQEVIRPALEEGMTVLCDRYHDATLAYQGHARGIGLDFIDRLAGELEILQPDLTLVLDMNVKKALRRAVSRDHRKGATHQGRFEAEDIEFHCRVREGYILLQKRNPGRIILIPAEGTVKQVQERIWSAMSGRLEQ